MKSDDKLSTLVVLRHGPTTLVAGEQRLSELGKKMAKDCADEIIKVVGQGPVTVLTSRLKRAVDTGEEIAKVFAVSSQQVSWLNDKDEPAPVQAQIDDLLQELPTGAILILVTHRPQVEQLTGYKNANYCTPYIDTVPS